MQNSLVCATQTFNRSVNQMLARLCQYLNGDIIRDMPALISSRRKLKSVSEAEKPFNLFESHCNKRLEHTHFAH